MLFDTTMVVVDDNAAVSVQLSVPIWVGGGVRGELCIQIGPLPIPDSLLLVKEREDKSQPEAMQTTALLVQFPIW